MAEIPGLGACKLEIEEATGGRLSEAELKQIADFITKTKNRLLAAGEIGQLDAKIAQAAKEEGSKMKLAAALAKKQAAIAIIKRDRLLNKFNKLLGGGLTPKQAMLAIFDGSGKFYATMFRDSVAAKKLHFETKFHGRMIAEIEAQVPVAKHLLNDKAFAKDVLKELWEIRDGGKPGITGNKDAQTFAAISAKYMELSRTTMNFLGGNIHKLEGYAPQVHNPDKIQKVGQDEWVQDLLVRLDMKKTFPDLDKTEVEAILRSSYLTIVTGRNNDPSSGKVSYKGPNNLAKTLTRDRIFFFKTAEDWLAYNDAFGSGNAITSVMNHQRHMASVASQMDTFGANPEALLTSFLDEQQTRIKNDPSIPVSQKDKQIASLTLKGHGNVANAFAESKGTTFITSRDHMTFAKMSGGWRAIQSMAKLGGAVISSIADVVTQAANLRYQGVPLFEAYSQQIGQMIRSIGKGVSSKEKEIAYLLGEGFDGFTHHIISSAYAQDSVSGFMSNALINYFRWSGLSWWTDSIRATGARIMSAHMGKQVSKGWAGLDENLKFVMGQYGITEKHWDVIRQGNFLKHEGKTYVTTDVISNMSDTLILPLVEGEPNPRKIQQARLDLELALGSFFSDEVNFGVIETDAASRRITLQGTQAGTPTGEIMRHITQFKGWPVAFTQRVIGRAMYGQKSKAAQVGHIGHLIAGLTAAGYASMTVKDYLKGSNPRDPADKDTILAAMLAGGAAGIYGDFLLGKVDSFGGGLADTILGPGITSGIDAVNLLKTGANTAMAAVQGEELTAAQAGVDDALNFVLSNTPYANLSYVRPGLDWLALNSMKESISPGFLSRQRKKKKDTYNQTLWHKQTAF